MNLAGRRALRLRLRDLAAGSAFTAVALSGSLPWPVTALFAVAFGVSLFGQRPFSNQRAWSVVLLLIAAVALFGLAFRGVFDLVVAAVAFATLVTAHRMLSEPNTGTDQQVLLASLLLMAGAAALSGEVWYSVCLLFFGVFACLALGLTVIEGPVERDEELPLSPVLKQVSIGVAIALAGGIAFFVLFPRLSWNVAARRSGPGLLGGTTGMTDRVRLGGGGDIKTSARAVFKVRLEPSPGDERLERYWVGRRFDTFDGKEWRGTGQPASPRPMVMRGDLTRSVRQRIELLPAYGSRTLVALEQPMAFGPAQAIGTNGSQPVNLVPVGAEEIRFAEDANAYSYVAHSRADLKLLEKDEAVLEPLKALPETLDPRVVELAGRIVGDEKDPARVARRLERWLTGNLEYTLELPGDVNDPLADFLFVRKAGHCEHFATALAVMLRVRGVPARVVGGFFGGERLDERYIVRAGDAHAWVEAYSPEDGWLTLDATPESGRGARPQALIARAIDAYQRLEELWRSRVVDYSIIDQWNLVRELIRPPRGSPSGGDQESPADTAPARTPTRAVFVAVGAGLVAWLLWRRFVGARAQVHPAAGFLAELERRLTKASVARQEHEDLEALSRRLSAERHRLAQPVERATRRYLEARFGQRPLSRDERKALLDAFDG